VLILALENIMKIKDILGEADVTLKPMPGAQEVDIDGKPVGTATTPQAATAISDLAKKGEFTPAGDDQQTSEDQLDGGSAPQVAPSQTDVGGPGVSLDNAETFKNAIKQQVDPSVASQVDQLVATEPDGTVDADQTLYNMLKLGDQVIDQMADMCKKFIDMLTAYSQSPEFKQATPADQQSVLQSIKDMQAQLPKIEKAVADAHAQFKQNDAQMQQNIKDRKMNQQLKGTTPPVQEELNRLRKLSGQAESQSVMPSRNDPALAQQAAQSQPGHQSVMPSRNKSQYTADEMTAILSGQKTQQQVDAEKAAATKESHHDLVSQGNHDVGGDATDNFINQIRDKKWEKANRAPASGTGTRSPLSEKDELYKWLTIAGIK